MSEEVTYADLKFQDSSNIEHMQKFDQIGIKGKILNYGWFVSWYKWSIEADRGVSVVVLHCR